MNMNQIYTIVVLLVFSFVSNIVSAQSTVRVFVLAGQSNMQGQGKIYLGSTGAIGDILATFTPSCIEPDAETCDYTFNMLDGYGDGWNGWTYDFVQGGVVVATETLPNGLEGTAIVTLEDGISCDVVVNNAGAYGAEISWTLTNQFGDIEASMTGQNESYPSPNTLLNVIENDTDNLWSMLETDGEWSVMDNAYLYFENGDGDLIRDKVSIAQGANPDMIGPELMFAHQMDEYYEDPVLIIKAAWGGLSLAEDFRPPSAGGVTGASYLEMIEMVEYVTENIATEFSEIGMSEFELAGFAWFQGWNDGGSEDFLNEYESNMNHLVNDVRDDLDTPDLPFVIASSGQGGYESHGGWMQDMQEIVSVAQENVGCDDIVYGGTVGFVNTKPFYMDVSESPEDAGYHYHHNALSFLNIGKSIGDEMILAINDLAFCSGFTSVNTENEQVDWISIYPNPTTNSFYIDLANNRNTGTVVIRNVIGEEIMSQEFENNQLLSFSIDEPAGIYLVTINSGGKVKTFRLLLEH
ncbi:MAG: hypothetical protein ACI9CU_001556 [Polaribacter sp.]|jgi:hypothetical protein